MCTSSKEPEVPVAASALFPPTVSITDLKKAHTGTHNNGSTKFIGAHVSKPDGFILSLLFGVRCLSQFFISHNQPDHCTNNSKEARALLDLKYFAFLWDHKALEF